MNYQGLFCAIGESFRTGSQNTRIRGLPESVPQQLEAFQTHVSLLRAQPEEVKPTLKVLTYKTQFSDLIAKYYGAFNPQIQELETPIGYNNLVRSIVDEAKASAPVGGWDFIFIFRIDLILKDKLRHIFNYKANSIAYPSVCWAKDSRLFNGRYRVNDMFLFVPKPHLKDLYEGHIPLNHNACESMPAELYNNVRFFLDTYHDSDSEKDKNPLYQIANRPESVHWHSEGLRVTPLGPIKDETKTYNSTFL